MTVYLIHADDGTHYTGYAKSKVGERIEEHANTICYPPTLEEIQAAAEMGCRASWTRKGAGAHYLGVLNYKGIRWAIVRTWSGASRRFEREIKNQKKPAPLCPVCNPATWKNNKPLKKKRG